MEKLIKYELKGIYKEIVILIGIIVIGNLLILTRHNVWPDQVIATFSLLLWFGTSIAVFIWNIAIFGRDLYGDTGYLLFSLPVKGYKIVAAKLITSFIQLAVINIVAIIFIYINVMSAQGAPQAISFLKENINPGFIALSLVGSIFEYIYILIMVYFSISISKVAIKNRKLGAFGTFVVFIVISLVTGKITDLLVDLFPQTLNVNILSPAGMLNVGNTSINSVNLSASPASFPISIIVFSVLMFIVFFGASSYLIENKIDM